MVRLSNIIVGGLSRVVFGKEAQSPSGKVNFFDLEAREIHSGEQMTMREVCHGGGGPDGSDCSSPVKAVIVVNVASF